MAGLLDRPSAVYRHFDKDGCLLYVGTCLSPLKRTRQHLDSSVWANEIATITITHFACRIDALAHEREAITSEKPKYNMWCVLPEVKRAAAISRIVSVLKSGAGRIKPRYSMREIADMFSIGIEVVYLFVEDGTLGSYDGKKVGRKHLRIFLSQHGAK